MALPDTKYVVSADFPQTSFESVCSFCYTMILLILKQQSYKFLKTEHALTLLLSCTVHVSYPFPLIIATQFLIHSLKDDCCFYTNHATIYKLHCILITVKPVLLAPSL